jgi:hypothetical protein
VPAIDIACDESGYEGERLIGTTTDVFAHSGVRIDADRAAGCIGELRDRIGSPATEYKANHLLRDKHRAALEWVLGPSAPLLGHAHAYLIDKTYYVLARMTEALLGDPAYAVPLYREGPRTGEPGPWEAFLVAGNDLLRQRAGPAPVDAFFRALDGLAANGLGETRPGADGPPAAEAIVLLRRSRPRAEALRARLADDPDGTDPLVPAITLAVRRWGTAERPVLISHHRQATLSRGRAARLVAASGGRLAGVRFVDSTSPRIQVADILAGVARKIASDELNGRGDARLTALLRPYVDASSIWGDPSWARLAP